MVRSRLKPLPNLLKHKTKSSKSHIPPRKSLKRNRKSTFRIKCKNLFNMKNDKTQFQLEIPNNGLFQEHICKKAQMRVGKIADFSSNFMEGFNTVICVATSNKGRTPKETIAYTMPINSQDEADIEACYISGAKDDLSIQGNNQEWQFTRMYSVFPLEDVDLENHNLKNSELKIVNLFRLCDGEDMIIDTRMDEGSGLFPIKLHSGHLNYHYNDCLKKYKPGMDPNSQNSAIIFDDKGTEEHIEMELTLAQRPMQNSGDLSCQKCSIIAGCIGINGKITDPFMKAGKNGGFSMKEVFKGQGINCEEIEKGYIKRLCLKRGKILHLIVILKNGPSKHSCYAVANNSGICYYNSWREAPIQVEASKMFEQVVFKDDLDHCTVFMPIEGYRLS